MVENEGASTTAPPVSRLTPAERAIQKAIREKANMNKKSSQESSSTDEQSSSSEQFAAPSWDQFKAAVSGGSVFPRKISDETGNIADGYSAMKGRAAAAAAAAAKKSSPLDLIRTGASTTNSAPPSPAPTPPPPRSVFDSVKEALYGTVDAASQLTSKTEEDENDASTTMVENIGMEDKELLIAAERILASFRPEVRSILQNSSELKAYVPDLTSNNPLKRLSAEWKIKELERREEGRLAAIRREEQIRKFKEGVYQLGDSAKSTADTVAALPGKAVEFAEQTKEFAESIPGKIDETVETVTSIPGKVERTAKDVQAKVDNTVESTVLFIDDVKAFPDRVQQKAAEVKESVEDTVELVKEVALTTMVALGLEKPKALPPGKKIPTPTELGKTALVAVATATGKTALWLGKGIVNLSIQGVKAAIASGAKDKPEEVVVQSDNSEAGTTTAVASEKKAESDQATASNTKGETELDRQVAAALQQAADALKIAEKK